MMFHVNVSVEWMEGDKALLLFCLHNKIAPAV
jgi:hypothetical protein